MRRNLIAFIVVAGTVGLSAWGVVSNGHARQGIVVSLHAAQSDGCSLATLSGDYLLVGEQAPTLTQRDDPSFPRRFAGINRFDGQGNLSAFVTSSQGGLIQRLNNEGTYTLESNCAGTVSVITRPSVTVTHWDLFISKDGGQGHYIRTDDGYTATLSIRRQ